MGKRLEKDLVELERLIKDHFTQRKKDEEDLAQLQDRIEKRKTVREEQLKARAEKEKLRLEKDKAAKLAAEEAEQKKKDEEEEAKKAAMAAMSMNFSGYQAAKEKQRRGKRGAGKDIKKKILAERRKILNVDHLNGEKLQEKAIELHKWMAQLEEEKYDYELRYETGKIELKHLRTRVNDLMGKQGKQGKAGKVNVRK